MKDELVRFTKRETRTLEQQREVLVSVTADPNFKYLTARLQLAIERSLIATAEVLL